VLPSHSGACRRRVAGAALERPVVATRRRLRRSCTWGTGLLVERTAGEERGDRRAARRSASRRLGAAGAGREFRPAALRGRTTLVPTVARSALTVGCRETNAEWICQAT
jgi:hypothetical protein